MRSHTTLFGMVLVALGGIASDAGLADERMDALILATDTSGIVSIDGVEWRKAPTSGHEESGRAGTRIILDGELWLRTDDPAFDRPGPTTARSTPLPVVRPAPVAPVSPVSGNSAAPAPEPVATPSPPETLDELRIRQKRLLSDARARREARGEMPPSPAPALDRIGEPPPLGSARAIDRHERQLAEARARNASALDRSVAVLTVRSYAAKRDRELAEASARDAVAADAVAEQAAGEAAYAQTATVSALQLPHRARQSADRFSYLQLMPLSYDIGGGGVMVEGSGTVREHVRLMARAAIADRYSEALVGMGLFYTPPTAERLTLIIDAGYEYGVFPLENVQTGLEVDDASAGPFINAGGRLVVSPRFVLEGGVGYSSFHEGDPIAFGSGFFHVSEIIDLMSRVELGDQDSYGIGIRVHY